jgi:hypothetical protein
MYDIRPFLRVFSILCMYVYMYVCTYVCMCVCTFESMYVFMYVYDVGLRANKIFSKQIGKVLIRTTSQKYG